MDVRRLALLIIFLSPLHSATPMILGIFLLLSYPFFPLFLKEGGDGYQLIGLCFHVRDKTGVQKKAQLPQQWKRERENELRGSDSFDDLHFGQKERFGFYPCNVEDGLKMAEWQTRHLKKMKPKSSRRMETFEKLEYWLQKFLKKFIICNWSKRQALMYKFSYKHQQSSFRAVSDNDGERNFNHKTQLPFN